MKRISKFHRDLMKSLRQEGFEVVGIDTRRKHPQICLRHEGTERVLVTPLTPSDNKRTKRNAIAVARRLFNEPAGDDQHGYAT